MYTLSSGKMANAPVGGCSLANDLAELRGNECIIEDYKKTVLVLESKPHSTTHKFVDSKL